MPRTRYELFVKKDEKRKPKTNTSKKKGEGMLTKSQWQNTSCCFTTCLVRDRNI